MVKASSQYSLVLVAEPLMARADPNNHSMDEYHAYGRAGLLTSAQNLKLRPAVILYPMSKTGPSSARFFRGGWPNERSGHVDIKPVYGLRFGTDLSPALTRLEGVFAAATIPVYNPRQDKNTVIVLASPTQVSAYFNACGKQPKAGEALLGVIGPLPSWQDFAMPEKISPRKLKFVTGVFQS